MSGTHSARRTRRAPGSSGRGAAAAALLVAGQVVGGLVGADASAQSVTPEAMPGGFDFPTPGYVIQQWVSADDQVKITTHGWTVWNAMTQPSTADAATPVWLTWLDQTRALTPELRLAAEASSRPATALRVPRQFAHMRAVAGEAMVTEAAAAQPNLTLETERFDPNWVAFANAPQIVPFGTFSILGASSLNAYVTALPSGTSAGARAILDFPGRAIETKPVFYALKSSGKTVMPYWQGPAGATNATNPLPGTWQTCVIVDADNNATSGMAAVTDPDLSGVYAADGLACANYLTAPLGMIFTFPLSAADASAFNQPQIGAGDLGALVAMHVNTKEVDQWTWQTFYWQGEAQFAAGVPGNLDGQPASLAAPWSSYAMCTAYDQSFNGTMVVCYNPYLETSPGIPDGINSNCVSCHGMAAVVAGNSTTSYPADYGAPIAFDDPALFGNAMKTDFSWTIADQVFAQ